jgi:hypothetical protein
MMRISIPWTSTLMIIVPHYTITPADHESNTNRYRPLMVLRISSG